MINFRNNLFWMLEIACFEITSAEIALRSVADRIEFCSGIEVGGLTPNIDEFRYLKAVYRKPIFVMIRPKASSFFYADEEFELMKRNITAFKKSRADGFVFGILDEHGEIDMKRNRELIELSGEIPCTFHRAFDRTKNLDTSIQRLIDLGFKTVLTSGGKKSAMEGKEILKDLIQKYAHQIDILIGGGVRSNNITTLKKFTQGKYFHSSAILDYEIFANDDEIKLLKQLSE